MKASAGVSDAEFTISLQGRRVGGRSWKPPGRCRHFKGRRLRVAAVPVPIPYSARGSRRHCICPARGALRTLQRALIGAESAAMIDPVPFVTYTFVMSITPGPNNVMLTASGANFGFRRTLPHILGIGCGFTVQLLAVCAGLAAVFAHWPALQSALAWVGAAYLVYLGWQMLGSADTAAAHSHHPLTFLQA